MAASLEPAGQHGIGVGSTSQSGCRHCCFQWKANTNGLNPCLPGISAHSIHWRQCASWPEKTTRGLELEQLSSICELAAMWWKGLSGLLVIASVISKTLPELNVSRISKTPQSTRPGTVTIKPCGLQPHFLPPISPSVLLCSPTTEIFGRTDGTMFTWNITHSINGTGLGSILPQTVIPELSRISDGVSLCLNQALSGDLKFREDFL